MSNPEKASVDFWLDERGNFIIAAHNREIAVNIDDLNPRSRNALIEAARHAGELKSVSQLLPNEKVVAADACSILIDGFPVAVMRGQVLDNPEVIAEVLKIMEPKPIRLLRGLDVELADVLREAATAAGQRSLAMSQIVLKRAVAAYGG